MGKITGFIDYKRKDASYKTVEQRIKNYKEFIQYLPEAELQKQAARCMDCGIPFCHTSGCPVFNLIPEWNDLVYKDLWQEALARLEKTITLPEITGRICPAPCETACTLAINESAVTIKQVELAIIERGFKEGWVKPRFPKNETGKKVAIIGSGPAGLAAAIYLRRMGHRVTVFEKDDRTGGILRYGIPDFKLEKWVLNRRIELMRQEGIIFDNNVIIGEDLSARYLKKSFNAILLTMGAGQPRDLNVPGRELEGIYSAMDYLTKVNKYIAGDLREDQIISARNKNVLVIGGGDTGSDCIGTAHRQGAREVFQFEILPKPFEWKKIFNPQWPNWPKILTTSSSQEEGVVREWSILTKKFSGKNRNVEKVHYSRLEWQLDGNQQKMVEITGSETSIKVDLVLLAMGFVHVEHNELLKDLGIEYDEKGNIKCDQNYTTNITNVFTAGDANLGASLVVRAIYHGQEAAKCIDRYLSKNI
jgi:glutamate synthase (NADPH/NADH) small chain